MFKKVFSDEVNRAKEKIKRRANAIQGKDEYKNSGILTRVAGVSGLHDDGVYKKKTEKKQEGIKPGDIICVSRKHYDHYGVFVNEREVINYTSKDSDISSKDNVILSTSLKTFLRGVDKYSVLVFPDRYGEPGKLSFSSSIMEFKPNILRLIKEAKYKLFSLEETIKRAKSRLGEKKYNTAFNNCEHFALWCKTDISESHQINRLLKLIGQRNVGIK